MTSLYLVRHARTKMSDDDAERWPLSEEGERQADILAQRGFWREVALILSSPEPKALQTAKPAARRWSIPLETANCLHEVRRPHLMPDYENAVARFFSDPETSIAGLEPAAQASERITRCIKGLSIGHPGKTLAIVSHGLVTALFLARLESHWPTVAEWRAIPFAGLAVVDTTTWHLIKNWSDA
ncbi:MAG: histidine phosphatase family protein [Anaerolineae bacterium]|nr:histidine phosphatase family protein [Anaerolineae bacterium]